MAGFQPAAPGVMNLIKMVAPVYSRLVWMSPAAKARWETPINDINKVWGELERLLVLHGHRAACQQPLNLADYNTCLQWAEEHDLNVGLIRIVKPWQGFAHRYEGADEKDPSAFRVVAITRDPKLCADFVAQKLSDDQQGEAFGYPKCCRTWFPEVFPKYLDPVWQTATNSKFEVNGQYSVAVKQNPLTSPFLRYTGVRLVNYISCSMQCEPSEAYARLVLEVITKEYGQKLVDDIMALLSMNLEWSANKGIALIKTPVLQICSGSVPCYPKHTVHLVQEDPALAYPECSVEGVRFPYRRTC
jgi:hypothetical protein